MKTKYTITLLLSLLYFKPAEAESFLRRGASRTSTQAISSAPHFDDERGPDLLRSRPVVIENKKCPKPGYSIMRYFYDQGFDVQVPSELHSYDDKVNIKTLFAEVGDDVVEQECHGITNRSPFKSESNMIVWAEYSEGSLEYKVYKDVSGKIRVVLYYGPNIAQPKTSMEAVEKLTEVWRKAIQHTWD